MTVTKFATPRFREKLTHPNQGRLPYLYISAQQKFVVHLHLQIFFLLTLICNYEKIPSLRGWPSAYNCRNEPNYEMGKHTYIQSMIVNPNVQPKKIYKIAMDGACFFSCISYALFKDTKHNQLIREYVCQNIATMWTKPKVKLLAALFYQDKTKDQLNVRPSMVNIDPEIYLEVSDMRTTTTWAGSTEIEVAAHWLQTPIRVFNLGNPKFPPNSWTTYGPEFVAYDSRSILLQWANGNHYNYVVNI